MRATCGSSRSERVVDLNTCGGTLVSSPAEIEVVALLSVECLRGGTRLSFVAGRRARRRLWRHEERNAGLRALLGGPDDGLAGAARAKLEQLTDAQRALRRAGEELAAAAAEAALASNARVVHAGWTGGTWRSSKRSRGHYPEEAGRARPSSRPRTTVSTSLRWAWATGSATRRRWGARSRRCSEERAAARAASSRAGRPGLLYQQKPPGAARLNEARGS